MDWNSTISYISRGSETQLHHLIKPVILKIQLNILEQEEMFLDSSEQNEFFFVLFSVNV